LGEFKEYCVALFGPQIYNAAAAKARGNISAAAFDRRQSKTPLRGGAFLVATFGKL
jgi:hypothetical protein